MATPYDSLTQIELRAKLLELGYDLPVSVQKDFLIKQLVRVTQERRKSQATPGRKSIATATAHQTPSSLETNSNSSSHSTNSNVRRPNSRMSVPTSVRSPVRNNVLEDVSARRPDRVTHTASHLPDQGFRTSGITASALPSQNPATRSPAEYSTEEEDQEDEGEEEEEEEDHTPSPRYQKYLSYFKGDTRSADPPSFSLPRSRYSSPVGSPYSTTATAGSPSNRSQNFDDSEDDSEDEELERPPRQSAIRRVFNFANPVSWIPSPRTWFSSKNIGAVESEGIQTDNQNKLNFNFGSGSGNTGRFQTASPTPSTRYSTSNSNTGLNGHFVSGRAGLANQIYSPAQPPPPPVVAPAMAAGRQAGFKAFFSRGERNGYGYSSTTGVGATTDSSHLIPTLLKMFFIVAFVAVIGAYVYKTSQSQWIQQHGLEDQGMKTLFEDSSGSSASPQVSARAPPKPAVQKPTSLVYPICGTKDYHPEHCVPKSQIRNAKFLFDKLRKELVQRNEDKMCGADVEDKITLQRAKDLLYRIADMIKPEVDSAFSGMLMLATENPTFGMKIESKDLSGDVTIQDILSLDNNMATITVEGISPGVWCLIVAGTMSLLKTFFFFGIVSACGVLFYKAWIYWRGQRAREEQEMFEVVEKILELLQEHYEEAKATGEPEFLAVSHIRDTMFIARDRKKKAALWNQVVAHISNNESRVREETQHVSGEEFQVWRWLPSASPLTKRMSSAPSSPGGGGDASMLNLSSGGGLYPNLSSLGMELDSSGASPSTSASNSKWQGQAFEMFDGSPNSLAQPPTTCLKIRQMYDSEKDSGRENRIEQAILEKCPKAKIMHVGIDRSTREGCVYVRCLTKLDARNAYCSLHGWWFDGHLLSVKFLREDRYFSRFPDAQFRTVPLTLATLSSPIQPQPLAGQQNFSNTVNTMRSGSLNAHQAGPSPRVRYTMGY